jgi:NADH dehydrogenase (ubiquinone) 1 alpha/beta subcomplex 1
MALSQLRSAVLAKLRLPVGISSCAQQTVGGTACLTLLRGFAEGTYLDKNQVTERILNVVKHFDKVEPSKVTPEAKFKDDLGLDSLDTVEVVMAFEEEFSIEIPDSEADKILSTREAIDFIASHPQAK